MLTDRRCRRQRAYLLSEGHVLGALMTMFLLKLWGAWAAFGWLLLAFLAWNVNWLLVGRADKDGGVGSVTDEAP